MSTPAAPRTNWSGTVHYGFSGASAPGSVAEVQRLVASQPRLRVVGTGHTFNDVADGEHAVLMSAFTGVEPAVDGTSVRVGGGATYAQVAEALRPHGLALGNLASLPHIGVAGAVATATHGSGRDVGNLATFVRAVELVTGSGEVLTLRRGDPDFHGAVVSLGTLGVVTALELDVEPERPWRQQVLLGLPEADVAQRMEEMQGLARSVSIFTRWDGAPTRVWLKRRGDDPDAPVPDGLHPATTPQHPIEGLDAVNCTPQLDQPGWWADRIPHFRTGFLPSNGDESQSEYHVPLQHGAAAVQALRAAGPELADAMQTSEIRTVGADEHWLSPQHGRATWAFHFTWTSAPGAAEHAAQVLEDALADFDVRPHWGKTFHTAPRPERLADFRALRARLDPDERFVNDWVRRTLLSD